MLVETLLRKIATALANGRSQMTKITAEHLACSAFVYIRQLTADQLVHNQESRRRQYGLADRAHQFGWATIEVIDDDLGRSGGGINRPGFERLLGRSAKGMRELCSRLRHLGWRATAATGIRLSSSVDWSGPSSSTRTESTNLKRQMVVHRIKLSRT
ncbi:recombinase family protein [Mesorhizobium sp.]|uniref:recombinase family protein n=1 Tax=Mesorhizobium sp. TaxID=1871066 RepID=UPI00338F29CB